MSLTGLAEYRKLVAVEERVEFIAHAEISLRKRGVKPEEVIKAITEAEWHKARFDRIECELEFPYNAEWNGKYYERKRVRPVFKEKPEGKVIVITVYSFYY